MVFIEALFDLDWNLTVCCASMRAHDGACLEVTTTRVPSSCGPRQLLDVVHQTVQLPLR
jgi:hypothetical protein